jgi:hypothetical protein
MQKDGQRRSLTWRWIYFRRLGALPTPPGVLLVFGACSCGNRRCIKEANIRFARSFPAKQWIAACLWEQKNCKSTATETRGRRENVSGLSNMRDAGIVEVG